MRPKWASEMTDAEIDVELAEVNAVLDHVAADDEGHGGSPGEWHYERHDELTREKARRVKPAAETKAWSDFAFVKHLVPEMHDLSVALDALEKTK